MLWFTLDGFFWGPRSLLGIEPHFYAFYEQPDLLHRINSDLATWHLRVIDEICKTTTPDFMTFAEDLSYNHGPMLSKGLFDEFLLPYYRRVVPELHRRGILVFVDSDGDVTQAADWFAEAGFDGMLPIERQAGTDLAAVRARLPRMRFIGCFDKMTMHRGEAAMRAEFERLLPFAIQGGLAISCYHQDAAGSVARGLRALPASLPRVRWKGRRRERALRQQWPTVGVHASVWVGRSAPPRPEGCTPTRSHLGALLHSRSAVPPRPSSTLRLPPWRRLRSPRVAIANGLTYLVDFMDAGQYSPCHRARTWADSPH